MRGKMEKLNYLQWLASAQGPREHNLRKLRITPEARWLIWLYAACLGLDRPIRSTVNIPSSPLVKILAIRWYARRFRLKSFVETGTYYGATTAAVAAEFDRCFTIELSDDLYQRSLLRLASIGNVVCLHGDSGTLIQTVINQLAEPALFWLDAHTSGGITANAGYDPMQSELSLILNDRRFPHLILVDDARGHDIDHMRTVAKRHTITVRNDIARIVPTP